VDGSLSSNPCGVPSMTSNSECTFRANQLLQALSIVTSRSTDAMAMTIGSRLSPCCGHSIASRMRVACDVSIFNTATSV